MTDRTIQDAATLNGWRKSSYSSPNADSCLEVMDDYATGVPVRDSKAPQGPALLFSPLGWTRFVASVKHGTLHH